MRNLINQMTINEKQRELRLQTHLVDGVESPTDAENTSCREFEKLNHSCITDQRNNAYSARSRTQACTLYSLLGFRYDFNDCMTDCVMGC